ncbi:MAG: hypothetical protein HYV09_40210 [Deltaproteobacteria bacterium]|nr:hypothetical protein [Deltaproteobacteria bacterium]
MMYECLTGVRPTQADSLGQILKIVTEQAIAPLEQVAPLVPHELTDLVGRMLMRDRTRRPQSLTEVFATLRRYTDATARSFAEPTGQAAPMSSGGAQRVVSTGTGDRSESALAATALPTSASPSSDDVRASAASAHLSTTAAISRDKLVEAPASGPRGGRALRASVAGAAIVIAGAAAWMLVRRHDPSGDPSSSAAPPATTAASAPRASTARSAEPSAEPSGPPGVPTTPPATAASSPPVPSTSAYKLAASATAPSPKTTKTADATTSPPPAVTKAPGDIIEKPPF